jgi:hypothetical protein
MNNNPLFWVDPTGEIIKAFVDKERNRLAIETYDKWL